MKVKPLPTLVLLLFGQLAIAFTSAWAQQTLQFNDLSHFTSKNGTWKEVSNVWADPFGTNQLNTEKGQGIIANLPTGKKPGADLFTNEQFGDLDLELDFMIPQGSNSGIYLIGQYELQLLDSWTKTTPTFGDNGGIYQRWNEALPDGQKGYEGYAPRQNASKAPGVWQHLKISFQGPRFNDRGEKIQNAKFLSVLLNGVLIHENLEVQGPTRGSMFPKEQATGPIRIQGDHGPVAIRNFTVKAFEGNKPVLHNLTGELFKGVFEKTPDFGKIQPDAKEEISALGDSKLYVFGPHLLKYRGTVQVQSSGTYKFFLDVPRGFGSLEINGFAEGSEMNNGRVLWEKQLEQGEYPIEIIMTKNRDWSIKGLDLMVSADYLRNTMLAEAPAKGQYAADPILVNRTETPILRSFINLPEKNRLSHALSVSSNQGVHYTMDLSTGNVVQLWRGQFLDATPMWNDRGNGVAVPLGALTFLGQPENRFVDEEFKPSADIRSKGYQIQNDREIQFNYFVGDIKIKDKVSILESGKGIQRSILLEENPAAFRYYKVITSAVFKKISDKLYLAEDKGLYIRLSQENNQEPHFENSAEGQTMYLQLKNSLEYEILF